MPEVIGGGGVKLHVREGGNANGVPLVFIHGYCQSADVWERQFSSDRLRNFHLLAMDLRGHGNSEKPEDPEAYKDSQLWADDLAAVLDRLRSRRAVVIAWSYGGRVVGDYLRAHGSDRIAAIAFVSAIGAARNDVIAPQFAALFPAAFSPEPAVAEPALRRFVELSYAPGFKLDEATQRATLAAELRVPAVAREAMLKRGRLHYDDVLAKLQIPVVCMHGTDDAVILPVSSEQIAAAVPNAKISRYTGVGHSPFFEAPLRFNREIAELASSIS
jgi:non-heme chloroperoxidase